jgi:hypothetical protein
MDFGNGRHLFMLGNETKKLVEKKSLQIWREVGH